MDHPPDCGGYFLGQNFPHQEDPSNGKSGTDGTLPRKSASGGWPMLSPKQKCGCPALLAFLAGGRGFLADIAAANHWINAELLTTTDCPVRLNFHPAFSSGGIAAGWPKLNF